MRITLTKSGCTLHREPTDGKLRSERAVSYAILQMLRAQGIDVRRTRGPQGLTSCPSASILRIHSGAGADSAESDMLWHERYAVEASHEAFNDGSVWFQRVTE